MRYLIALLVLLFIAALVFKVPIVRAAIGLTIASTLLFVVAVIEVGRIPHPRAVPAPVANTADNALWHEIRPDQITIAAQILKRRADDQDFMDYTATIMNNSDRDADKLSLRIRLYDCPGKPPEDFGRCFTIGDHSEQLTALARAHGAADISGRFHFTELREVNNVFAWRAEVTKVHAAER